jgi:hypothetical protein
MHVRTPIMIGVVLVLVIVLSWFCYYRVGTVEPWKLGIFDVDAVVPGLVSQGL